MDAPAHLGALRVSVEACKSSAIQAPGLRKIPYLQKTETIRGQKKRM